VETELQNHQRVKCEKWKCLIYGGRMCKFILALQTVLSYTRSPRSWRCLHQSQLIKPYFSLTFSTLSQFPDHSLTFPCLCTFSLTLPWPILYSLTFLLFPGFPGKWSIWISSPNHLIYNPQNISFNHNYDFIANVCISTISDVKFKSWIKHWVSNYQILDHSATSKR